MLYAGLSARKWGIPTLWHVRVIDSEGWYDKLLAGLSTKIIAISEAVMKRFQWLHAKQPDKVKMIYNGVDIDAFHPDIKADHIREEFNIRMSSPIIGIIGNLLKWKGQRNFLQAASEIVKVIPDAKFLIVGDGEDKGYLMNLCHRLGLGDCVFFTGRRYDIPKLMAAMDVIIHASVEAEPFGRVVIEGMAMGKVVVATNAGGVREIIENDVTGFLIPPRNSSVMAEIIVQLIKDPARRKDVEINARRRVERYFSLQEHTRQIENLYRQIISLRQVGGSRYFVRQSDIIVGK
jgi:glycosyltransferase involved in cell wall biosynthesis